jgi:hypothetical protein
MQDDCTDGHRVRLEPTRHAAKAPARIARLVGQTAELGGVSLANPLTQSTAVRLRLDSLTREQLPGILVTRQHALMQNRMAAPAAWRS